MYFFFDKCVFPFYYPNTDYMSQVLFFRILNFAAFQSSPSFQHGNPSNPGFSTCRTTSQLFQQPETPAKVSTFPQKVGRRIYLYESWQKVPSLLVSYFRSDDIARKWLYSCSGHALKSSRTVFGDEFRSNISCQGVELLRITFAGTRHSIHQYSRSRVETETWFI